MKKRVLAVGLCLVVLVALIYTLAPFLAVNTAEPAGVCITILHTNDIHGRLKEDSAAIGGYARIAAMVQDIRKNDENVLLLDAGDTFEGDMTASLSRGQSVTKILNSMGYDAMVAGNHDFGYGWERLAELSQMVSFPLLSANVYMQDGERLLLPYVVKELNGVRAGILGLTTPETVYKTHPQNVAGLIFADPVQTAKEMVPELRSECDLLIALAHLPLQGEGSCQQLAEEVEGIDLIVSGHSHVVLEDGFTVNNTLITQAGEYGQYLGTIRFALQDKVITEKKAALYPVAAAAGLPPDAGITSLISELGKDNEAILSEVIGWTDVPLDGDRAHVRTGETNLGNLIAEAMMKTTGADGALTNGGGIRASIDAGGITRGEILNVLPFGNYAVLMEVKGADLRSALEHGVSGYPVDEGRFPQVAGIVFRFDPSREAGNRVAEVSIGGEMLHPGKIYRLAMNDFIVAGGDGYEMFKHNGILREYSTLESIVTDYIQGYGTNEVGTVPRIVPLHLTPALN